MQIFVRTLAPPSTLTLDVAPSDTVDAIAGQIEARTGIPPREQRLLSGRRYISRRRGQTLAACGIGPSSTVQLLLGLNGGGGDGGSTANDRLWVEMRADINAPGTSWEKWGVGADPAEVAKVKVRRAPPARYPARGPRR